MKEKKCENPECKKLLIGKQRHFCSSDCQYAVGHGYYEKGKFFIKKSTSSCLSQT